MMFENVEEVELRGINARMRVEGWESDIVEVNYVTHGRVKVKTELKGRKLIVREEPERRIFGLNSGGAEIEVKLPVNVPLKVRNVNGTVIIRGCRAEYLDTINGEIDARFTIAGPLRARTVNGRLNIVLEEIEGDIDVSTVNGDVNIRLSDFCDARISVRRVNGSVRFVGIDPEEPLIGSGTYKVEVKTVNGSVSVELAPQP
ncbi:hypothetical protein A3L12_05145 [Thermococcus sp. P6]|uniref:DUF4097 family beta strand repeat-containing protein n=1 Tax=Thermococcus sp. P6 TaxID=122420 RepID=UPI000B59BBB8|nr:DUF4097 family beta strand repeat-containing protein [Thermococcus sp. P6]ASJ10726.1 hypothetical protein A3L12_05145 [Thermococcus sp. P6]